MKKYLLNNGFISTKRSVYYRVISDLIQIFEIDFVISQWCYRIRFDLIPFCAGRNIESIYSIGASYSICLLNGETDENMPLCHNEQLLISDIVSKLEMFIFPLFSKCHDSFSAYYTLSEIKNDNQASTDNLKKTFYNFNSMFWLAIKNCDFSIAKKTIESIIEQNNIAFRLNMKHFEIKGSDTQSYVERHNERIQKWNYYLEILKPESRDELELLISTNENITKNSLCCK